MATERPRTPPLNAHGARRPKPPGRSHRRPAVLLLVAVAVAVVFFALRSRGGAADGESVRLRDGLPSKNPDAAERSGTAMREPAVAPVVPRPAPPDRAVPTPTEDIRPEDRPAVDALLR